MEMKTTIDIADDLLRRAKQEALERGTTLRAIIEEALTRALGPSTAQMPELRTVTWPPPEAAAAAPLDAAAIQAALDRERAGRLDEPAYWDKRFGFVPPAGRAK
jgi:hypothetical protein